MEMYIFYWLSAALFFLLLEMGHPGLFFFLSLSFGALAGAVVNFAQCDIGMQSFISIFITCVSFAVLYFIKRKYMLKHALQSNIFALQGKKGIVIIAIEPDKAGQVKLGGEVWMARSVDPLQCIPVGVTVEVVTIIGCHVRVRINKN